jgi:hypothetical protein
MTTPPPGSDATAGAPAGAIPPLDPTATALYAACEAAWDDEQRHDKFVKYCSASGLLASAARQYRVRLQQHPGDPTATKMQQRIVTMTSFLLTRHQPPPEPLTRSRWFLVLVGVAAIAGLLAALLYGR